MRFIKWCVALSCVSVLGIHSLSDAFVIKPTQAQIKEASDYGAKYKGKEVFDSDIVKKACFGDYPNGDGGIVMTKYIHTSVISAMMNMKEKTLSHETMKEIEESTTFNVVVVTSDESVKTPEDVQIMLKQGTNNILPQKTEFGMKRKDNKQSVDGTFRDDKVNSNASTNIVVKTKNCEKKYKVDFSDIK